MTATAKLSTGPNWWIVLTVMLTAILQVLDTTIVNVALPHILGAFGATPDQATWVLTSYIVSAAIIMPLTGYLSDRLGRRRLLIGSILGFVIASGLCGISWSLESLVAFRLLQGVCGATLVPLSQAILFDAYPRDQRGQAMAIWGLGIMVAPIMGPTLGGWITDAFNWRFVFYMNLPVGALALLLVFGQFQKSPTRKVDTDWVGLALMALAIGSLQLMLDQGQMRSWFSSPVIIGLTGISLVSFYAFIRRGWNRPGHIVDLTLFRSWNFSLGCLAIMAFGLGMFGSIALLPLFTQSLLHYPADIAGELFIPRGIASAISMLLVGSVLMKRYDPRRLILFGLIVAAVGTYAMSRYALEISTWALVWPGIIQGVGMGFVFVPLSTITYDGIASDRTDEAAGLYGLTRSVGSSIGIAISGALLVQQTAIHQNQLWERANPYNPDFIAWLAARGLSPSDPLAAPLAASEISNQAQMLAFIDIFWFLACSFAALVPLVLLMRRPRRVAAQGLAEV